MTTVAEAQSKTRPFRDHNRPRLYALDGLRLLAALAVCLFHYVGKGDNAWGEPAKNLFPNLTYVARYGMLGVQFFFLISGFVICLSSWGRSPADFLRSRFLRLYPAFWAAVILTTLACLIAPSVQRPPQFSEFLVNLTLLHQPLGVPRIIGVDWTLWVELRFYLLFLVFVVWQGVTYRRIVIFCAAWTLFGAVSYLASNPFLDQLAMREHSPYFIAGLAFYLIYRYGSNVILWGIVVVSWLLGQHQTIKILWNPDPSKTTLPRSPYILLLLITICFVIMAAVSVGLLNRIQWRWLPAAGALTYPFYLVHEHIGWFSISFLYRHVGLSAPITALLTAAAMMLLAFAIHRVIELRCTPILKRRLAGISLQEPTSSRGMH